VFPGGCFFVSAAAEFGSRPGPVREEVAGANLTYVLHDDPALLARARQAVRALLASPDRTTADPASVTPSG
jgi:hypothetical protein